MRIVAALDRDPVAVSAYRHRVFKDAKVASPQNWPCSVSHRQADVVLARQLPGAYDDVPSQPDLMEQISLVIERVVPRHFFIRVDEMIFEKGRPGSQWIGWWTRFGYHMNASVVEESIYDNACHGRWMLLSGSHHLCPRFGSMPRPREHGPLQEAAWPDDISRHDRSRLQRSADSGSVAAHLALKLHRIDPASEAVLDLAGGCGDFSEGFVGNVCFRNESFGELFDLVTEGA